MASHRQFQSEVAVIKGKHQVPMFALRVLLSTVDQEGLIPGTNKPYTVKKLVMGILKSEDKEPLIEMDPDRISFLFELVNRFKESALSTDEREEEPGLPAPEIAPGKPVAPEDRVKPSDIPF